MTEGVSVTLNKAGGIDVLLSEAVRERLAKVIADVQPCGAKRKRRVAVVAACEIRQITQGIKSDPVLKKYFNEDFTNKMKEVLLKKKLTLPTGPKKPVEEPEPEADSDGYFESEENPEIEEAIQLGSAEDAALLEGVAAAEVFPGASVSVGSFVALLWGALSATKEGLSNVYQVPKESIHTLTKTKTKATSTKSHSCPTETVGFQR
jgi:predicted RecA/RadA family phage recombinase